MTPERWQKVQSLLQAALERQPAERVALLDEACAGEDSLRKEVESLLASSEPDTSFLKSPAAYDAAALLVDDKPESILGQRIGGYQVISLLGAGGMGEVYLAEDPRLGRKVAIKLLPHLFAFDEERRNRFEQEARAASAVSHPNVATIYEIGEADRITYIAMEYVEGQTLDDRIKGRPLNSAEMIEISIQVADALAEAHSKGITHRDIKSANIMLTPRGQAKVLDFGLAKVTAATQDLSNEGTEQTRGPLTPHTTPGAVMGTVQYMSPEQAAGIGLDWRTDIFSLGVVMYEMATGRLPFADATVTETLGRIMYAQPEAITVANGGISSGLERIIRKCLQKEADWRYQTAGELIDDLRLLKQESDPDAIAGRARPDLDIRAATIGSIAVLPLKRLGSYDGDDYLGLGVADALITKLSSIRRVMVRPTSAVLKFDNAQQNAVEAGKELAVESVIEGHFRRSADRIRVTLQLASVRDGSILWAGKFDEKFTDIFALEDSISEQVAAALTLRLSDSERRLLAKRYTHNNEAHQAYLKGRYYWNKRTAEGLKRGIDCFQQALAEDESYALAYVGLADTFNLFGNLGHLPPREAFGRAKQAASRALQIDEALAEAHASLGYVKWALDWDWPSTEREYLRAIELNPGYATAHQWYGLFLAGMGRSEEAIAEARLAKETDPVSLTVRAAAGMVCYLCREYDLAIGQCKEALEMDPSFYLAHLYLGWVYDQEGRQEEAIAEARIAVDLSAGAVLPLSSLAYAYALSGDTSSAKRVLADLGAASERTYVPAIYSAVIQAALGEKDEAFAGLERAFDERSNWLTLLKVDPKVDSLRSDLRFQNLMNRVGFP